MYLTCACCECVFYIKLNTLFLMYPKVLVDVIRAHHEESHLTEMLDEVARKVVERGSTAGDKMPRVQVPTYITSLRGKVYL